MKNIHILQTDKPSRLHITSKLDLYPNGVFGKGQGLCKNQNIYITSDEKIKEGVNVKDKWVISEYGFVVKADRIENNYLIHTNGGSNFLHHYKFIILTTDTQLIKNGIQQIDDEFLEWFIKNPSCEEVETERFYSMSQSSYSGIEYEIIIPKEERKKNFYCGDEVDYGEQCDFQCERCVNCTGVDYGYLPNEDLGYTTKMGIEVSDEMVKSTMVPKKYFGEVETLSEKLEKIVSKEPSKFVEESNERVRIREEKVYNNEFHYQTRWLFDWLSKNDYLTDSREVLEKEYKEYLNNG